MKRVFYAIVNAIVLCGMISLNTFAMPYNPNNYTSVNMDSELLPPGIKQSKVTETARTRGEFFISADLKITNNGDGTIGALAVGLTRFPIEEAYITVYLDQWDAVDESWRQVNYYEAEFYAKDYPDGLSMPTVDITFTNQPRGCYYRLRGSFSVMYNGEYEGFSPVTDGILLD